MRAAIVINRIRMLASSLVILIGIVRGNDCRAAEETSDSVSLAVRSEGGWHVVDSQNFRCRCKLPESEARRLAESCEAWRNRLQKMWISNPDQRTDWNPKCDVVVHPNRLDYNQALNRAGDTSVGSTNMKFDQGRVVYSRIDVRADADDWSNAALPHELTHVVLGGRFGGHALPRWADEGIAMLSESAGKHRERMTNLRGIASRRQLLAMNDVVRMNRLPNPGQRDAFYGQSVALTSWLIQKSNPARFADFIEELQKQGIEDALRKHYQIEGIHGLQREWDQWVEKPEAMELVRLKLHEGLMPIIASIKIVDSAGP